MPHIVRPKISFFPVFMTLIIVIISVVGTMTWSQYNHAKQSAELSLGQVFEVEKGAVEHLFSPVVNAKTNWSRNQQTQKALQAIQKQWQLTTQANPKLSLELIQKVYDNQPEISLAYYDSIEKPVVSATERQLQDYIPKEQLNWLLEPNQLIKQAEILNNRYSIVAKSHYPPVFQFLQNQGFYVLLAGLGALIFSWIVVSLWQRKAAKQIDNSLVRYYQFVKHSNDWLWEVDKYGNITFSSENSLKIFGYKPAEMVGKSIYHFLFPERAEFDQQNFDTYVSNGADIQNLEIHFQSKNGSPVLIELNAHAQTNPKKQVTAYRGVGRDLTEQKQKQDSIVSMTYYDSLTQLPNRENLVKRLDQHLNQVLQRKDLLLSALIYIDLDDFKDINDYQGNENGNILLKEIANRMSQFVSQKDVVFRISGDQFVLLITSPNRMLMTEFRQKLETFVAEILNLISRPHEIDSQNAIVTASAGIVMIPQDGRTINELLSHANSAMYQAKRDGKNRYCYFDAGMRELEDQRKQMAKELKHAIENNEFELHYQLQMDVDSDNIYGMEALIRWPHPTRNAMVSPADFIQIAVESNHIQAIDEWVIKQATADLAKMQNITNKTIPVSINLSAKALENDELPKLINDQIKNHYLAPSDIRIEVTETSLLKNFDKAINILTELKDRGIGTSIDDFGTGYSSLSYLQKLPVDSLKIDKSFIDGIGSNQQDLKICKLIIQLAQSLDKNLIAEGVQSETQRDLLQKEGCHIIQGYLYSKPMPMSEIILSTSKTSIDATQEAIPQKSELKLVKAVSK